MMKTYFYLDCIQTRHSWIFILYDVRITTGLSRHISAEVHYLAEETGSVNEESNDIYV